MSKVAVVVPFKSEGHKSRLSRVLSWEERRALAHLLLRGVIKALVGAGLAKTSFLVSRDVDAMREAQELGVSSIGEERDSGVNAAVRRAERRLRQYDSFMVLPSDLPALSSSDLRNALALRRTASVVISPSGSFTGTNILVFDRGRGPRLSYDENSFWNHLASAASKGLSVAVYTSPGITLDLDTQRDARAYLDLGLKNPTTRFLKETIKT